MHECKTSGGHFFLHSPQIRSFICHRCHTPFTNYNPPVPRTSSARQWYVGLLDKDRPKAPWRCIVETCVFTVCQPCVDYIQRVLRQIREAKEAAERDGVEFDIAAELEKAEDEGRVGTETLKGPTDEKAEEDKWKEKREKRVSASFMEDGGDGKIEVDPMEVEVDDGDGEEYSIEFLKRTTTRSAAVAAASASARMRARRQTVVRRDSTRRGAAHD